MIRELSVQNGFRETILRLEYTPSDPLTIRVLQGTPEMREAVRSLEGHDFDRTVVIDRRDERFSARWGDVNYLDALAGYWRANFGWRTEIVESFAAWGSLKPALPHYVDLMAGTLGTHRDVRRFLSVGEPIIATKAGGADGPTYVYGVHQRTGGFAYAASSGGPR